MKRRKVLGILNDARIATVKHFLSKLPGDKVKEDGRGQKNRARCISKEEAEDTQEDILERTTGKRCSWVYPARGSYGVCANP